MTLSRIPQGGVRSAPGGTDLLSDKLSGAAPEPWVAPAVRLPVEVRFLDAATLARLRGQTPSRILGEIHFDPAAAVPPAAAHPCLRLDMPPVGRILAEVWLSPEPVATARVGDFTLARNEAVLFGCIHDPVAAASDAFEQTVHRRYRELLALVEEEGYPHLLRIWNYFPQINAEYDGLEVYQRFSRGRAQAFAEHYGEFHDRLPAASAVGLRSGGLYVYFIASRTPGRHRENPRQVSAYRYPPQYGPRSPSFARGTFKRWQAGEVLFISGTASIVGHETRHRGDPLAQFEETLRNLLTLIEVTARDEGVPWSGLSALTSVKVYLRDPAHHALLAPRLDAALGGALPVLYLRGDLCRRDLLLEIEGLASGR